MARLQIEKDARRMIEAHEEKTKVYLQKAADINQACGIRDSMIKDLQQKVSGTWADLPLTYDGSSAH